MRNSARESLLRIRDTILFESAEENLTKKRKNELEQYAFFFMSNEVRDKIGVKCSIPMSDLYRLKPKTKEEEALVAIHIRKSEDAQETIKSIHEKRGRKVVNAAYEGGKVSHKDYPAKYRAIRKEIIEYHQKNPHVSFTEALKKLAKKNGISERAAKQHIKKTHFKKW